MSHHRISRSAGGIGLATLASRVLGFARDVLMANYFGTGVAAQAFFAAFRIPNLMRRLFGEGALSASFIPIFTDELHKKGPKSAWDLAIAVFSMLSGVLVVLVGLGMLFAPQITRVIVPGFVDVPGQFELTASLLRIMFPYLLFICLAALMMGILNSLHHFAAPAAAPMLLNAVLIAYLVFFAGDASNPAAGLGIAVLAGGVLQLALQAAVAVRKGLPLGRRFVAYHPRVKRIAYLMLPAAGGLAVYQLNILVDSVCASYESIVGAGSIAALWYADRMMQFPLSIFGIATATAVFPALSAAAAARDNPGFNRTLEFGLRRVIFLTVPSAAGLIALRTPIISVLFERNEFDAYSVAITAEALMYYCIGLFAYAGVHVLSRGFYALQDTRTPVRTAMSAMLLNAVLNVILMHLLRVGGIALATSLSACVNFLMLIRRMSRRRDGLDARAVGFAFFRVLGLSLAMWAVVAFVWARMPQASSNVFRLLQLASLLGLGAAFFAAGASLLGFDEIKTIRSSFRRQTPDELDKE